MLVDLGSGRVLHARQPDLAFVPASMTKVMSVYVALDLMKAGKLAPDRVFRVNAATAQAWNGKGTSLYLAAGEAITTDQLLRGISTVSANDASIVLAEGYSGDVPGWTALMNGTAKGLGMNGSAFATPNGWPDNGATYVTARDLVTLSKALIGRFPDGYRRYFGQKTMDWHGVRLQSHDPTVGVVAGADGIKTGFTREAGYNFLGSAVRGDRRLVMVIAGAASEAQRAAASRALLEWGFQAWDSRRLFAANAAAGEAKVQGGHDRSVALAARQPIYATFPRGTRPRMTLTIRYKGPLVAPVMEGTEVAELEIAMDGAPAGRLPLIAAHSVGTANWLDRMVNGVLGLF